MQNVLIFIHNHWLLCLAFVVILLLLIFVEFIRIRRGARQINPRELTQLINHQNAIIIDLRTPETFASGHIVGAQSIPFSQLENKINKLSKYKSQHIILVCPNGTDSQRAAVLLMKHQINPLILASGIRGWQDAEMPLVKD